LLTWIWKKFTSLGQSWTIQYYFNQYIWWSNLEEFQRNDRWKFAELFLTWSSWYTSWFNIELDWFQLYDDVIYSTSVIYAAICNLSQDIRFKRENMLILSLLPSPNEVSLHKINYYLALIVNELALLWVRMILNSTFEYQKIRKIWAVLILVLCDIPVTRKICGHISALSSCYRCEKKANYKNYKHNFAGMNNMNKWFISQNSAHFCENTSDSVIVIQMLQEIIL